MTENKKQNCPSKLPCKFKRFSFQGAECTLEESFPKYIHAWCEKPWTIIVLKQPESPVL